MTGREALIMADETANNGVNVCLIWEAFAKRGVGFSASDGGSASTLSVTEAFNLSPICLPEPSAASLLVSGCSLLVLLERRKTRASRA